MAEYLKNSSEVPQYRPFSREQAERIRSWWIIYKDVVGLECDEYSRLKKEGYSGGRFEQEMQAWMIDREARIEDFNKASGITKPNQ